MARDPINFEGARAQMVHTTLAEPWDGRPPIRDPAVLDAMRRVPRECFLPERTRAEAYLDAPLPIGHRQTISQPYVVAMMTELLRCRPEHRVLEVGTGSGYQAAVLSELVARVYTLEVVPELADRARVSLSDRDNVHCRLGDGWLGWPEEAPFDGILVAAAPEVVPPALVAQLAPGGRLVVPVGPQLHGQSLTVVTKGLDGTLTQEQVHDVRFVPMVHPES